MTLDEGRGLLYLPTSTPSSDYYGGDRPGANLFAESLVCLDAATGKMKWYFQMVHHGLWDYDNPTAPNLVTITVGGRRIDAVAQVTKQGIHLCVRSCHGRTSLADHRASGRHRNGCARREAIPTQPFPSKPPAFVDQGVSLDDANDLTPQINALAREQMKNAGSAPCLHLLRSGARFSVRARSAARTGAARRSIPKVDICSCAQHAVSGSIASARMMGPIRSSKCRISNRFAGAGEDVSVNGLPLTSPPRGADSNRPQ